MLSASGGRQRAPRSSGPRRSVEVLGVRVDDVTYVEALALCEEYVAAGGPHLIATVNTEFVVAARADPVYRQILNGAALAVPDGIGLLLAAKLAGHPLREHVRGTDLVNQLACLSASTGYRMFFLGGQDGAGAAAAAALRQRWPGLSVAGCYEGSPDPVYDAETVAAVRAAGRVDILLVAYGAPAQERWIARNQVITGAPVAIGVGGVFNYLSGRVPRAPGWLRRLELEWLHRLLVQPWRWRRQLALPRFVLVCLLLSLAGRPVVREVVAGSPPRGTDH